MAKGKAKGKVVEAPQPEGGGGGLLIRDLWNQGTDSIHNMRDMNTDVVSSQLKTP